jgi:hypothetical protein
LEVAEGRVDPKRDDRSHTHHESSLERVPKPIITKNWLQQNPPSNTKSSLSLRACNFASFYSYKHFKIDLAIHWGYPYPACVADAQIAGATPRAFHSWLVPSLHEFSY